MYRTLLDSGLSARTVRYARSVVSKALSDAERKDIVTMNVARKADAPRSVDAQAPKPTTWENDQLATFLGGIVASDHFPMVRFLAFTGCRRGEARWLRWADVNLTDGYAVIHRTRTTANHAPIEGTTKSDKPRLVDLDPETLRVLSEWKAEQDRLRDLLGTGWPAGDYVFTMKDGRPWHPDVVSRAFTRLVEQSGLPRSRLHDLRHGHATALMNATHPRVVADRLCHHDPAFTLKQYTHTLKGQQKQVAADVAAAVDDIVRDNVRDIDEQKCRRDERGSGETAGQDEWALRDSNPRPPPCKGGALAS